MHFSFQKIFFIIASIIGLFAILILAKAVLIPIAFALLISFILFPVARKFESWGVNEIFSTFLSILGLFLIIGGIIFLFSNQIIQLSKNLTDFKANILNVFADATLFINKNLAFLPKLEKGELLEKLKTWLNGSAGALLSQTFSSTTNIIFGVFTSIVNTFLILIYRKSMVRALVNFFPEEHRDKAYSMFKSVQRVGQQYLFGMMIILLILGFANSFGLMIIGIDSPFLFGFLAAVLALIPYAGTFLGAAIPIVYALITYDSVWMPVSIAIFFWLIQFIESNFLTPKIVGGNLKINAFTSILSIIIGASVWGIAGMILFLPFASMFKVVCEYYDELKPMALLIGGKNYDAKVVSDKLTGNWYKKLIPLFTKFGKRPKKEDQTPNG